MTFFFQASAKSSLVQPGTSWPPDSGAKPRRGEAKGWRQAARPISASGWPVTWDRPHAMPEPQCPPASQSSMCLGQCQLPGYLYLHTSRPLTLPSRQPLALPDSSVEFSTPSSLLSLLAFLLAARGDPSTPAGQTQSFANFPAAPAPPGPSVSCILQGPLLSPPCSLLPPCLALALSST